MVQQSRICKIPVGSSRLSSWRARLLARVAEFHRATLLLKCEGLDDGRSQEPDRCPPRCFRCTVSSATWLRWSAAGSDAASYARPTFPSFTARPTIMTTKILAPLDDANWALDLAIWQAECEDSRRAAANHGLETWSPSRRGGSSLDIHPHD